MTLCSIVQAFNDPKTRKFSHKVFSIPLSSTTTAEISKREPRHFKTPYLLSDLVDRPFEEKLGFMIKAEVAVIGWGFISTVELDPDSKQFPVARFLAHPKAYMVLANGHRQIRCIKQIAAAQPTGDDQSVLWLAKFYDLEYLNQHPFSTELKFAIMED
ncbi:hypothetical protein M413DRAFT_32669 [Hebeloma cylindrosporum]|uniref:Uncharacterized protein n=1 Tax=Hebeloma cylindrosporum TaxID=76867 RepID=A0A0C2XB71_HEBCY|nr:hypothetical protein M413DRAFT_32669 [Hebeloma cylindrosporum h7]